MQKQAITGFTKERAEALANGRKVQQARDGSWVVTYPCPFEGFPVVMFQGVGSVARAYYYEIADNLGLM